MSKKFFLDTNILINAFLLQDSPSHKVVFHVPAIKYTNQFAIKEFKKILKIKYAVKESDISQNIEVIEAHCQIVTTPSKQEFKKLQLTDQSDLPIVCSAQKLKCILITEDSALYHQAKKYVKTVYPKELVKH